MKKTQKFGVGLAAFGVGLLIFMQPGDAGAAPPLAEWLSRLNRPTVRAALGSEAGRSFLSALGVADEQGLAYLLSISGPSVRGIGTQVLARELEEQLLTLQSQTRRFREQVAARQIEAIQAGNPALARQLADGLEAGEIELARALGSKLFRAVNLRRLRALVQEGITSDFVGLEQTLALRSPRRRIFLRSPEEGSEIFEKLASMRRAAPAVQEAAAPALRQRWDSWISRMNQCLENRPRDQTLRQRIAYWASEVGIEESITVSSRILGHSAANSVESGAWEIDFNHIDWDGIEIDMAVTLFATAFGGAVLSTSNRYLVQWRRFTVAQITADNSLDAVLYFISPAERVMQQDPSLPELTDVANRFGLATSFSLLNTWHEVGVYRLVDGLSCLYAGNWRVTTGLFGARVLYSIGGHSAYFGLRYLTLDQ
jgi:hypothetical protein